MKKSCFLLNLLVFSLFLFSAASARPTFTLNPVSDTVCQSGPFASFTVTAADSTFTINYFWQVSSDGGTTWSTVGGAIYVGDSTDNLTVTVSGTGLNSYKYRCIASDSDGLDTSTVAMLTIDTLELSGTVSGPSSICAGSSGNYTESVSGGVWVSTNTTLATISTSGVLTGIATGTDTVGYVITNICGSSAPAYKTVSIDSIPPMGTITGLDSVCQGGTVSLTESLTGGMWTSSNTSIATIGTTGVVTSIRKGFDTIKYTISTGLGCVGIADKVVRIDSQAVPLPISGPTTTCEGRSITLTNANINGVFSWGSTNSHAVVSSSGYVTGISGGYDTIIYTFTNACNTVDTNVIIQVDTPLAHGTITGPSSVCVGSWVNLMNSIPGGFWLSNNSSVAVVDGSGNVTGVSQGSTTISCLFENGCGVSASTYTMNVYRLASLITAHTDSLGIDSSMTLSDSTIGGSWTSGDTTIAIVNPTTGVVTGVGVGMVTLSYTVTNICGTSYATYSVLIGSLPDPGVIAGSSDVCVNRTTTLTDGVTGGVWSITNANAQVNFTTGLVTGLIAGADTINYTVTNAFGTSTASQVIIINTTPVIHIMGPAVVSLGGDYYPIAVPAGGVWSSSNNAIGFMSIPAYGFAGDTTFDGQVYFDATYCSVIFIAGGIDTLHYTYSNSCGTADSIFIVSIPIANSVNTITGKPYAISLYPNPNNGAFSLTLPADNTEEAHVVITNLLGQIVKEINVTTNQSADIFMNQAEGTYFLTATTASGKYATQFTISK